MTRREEIQWEAGGIVNRMIERGVSQCYDTYYQAFQEGAKWADKTMIEKAVEWLKKYTYQDCLGVSPIARLKVGFSSVEELIEDFRKAMEE